VLDGETTYLASKHPNAAYQVIESHCDTFLDCARNIRSRRLEL